MFKASLRQINPFIEDFVQIYDLPESIENLSFVINPETRPKYDHPRVHSLNLKEVAVLTNEKPVASDIVIQRRSGSVTTIADTHRAFDALNFILLFPNGSDGWHLKISQK